MEFSDKIQHQILLLDEVLQSIGTRKTFENAAFSVELGSAGYHQMVIHVTGSEDGNNLPLSIWLQSESLRLDVCGLNEAFEWTDDDIFKSRADVVSFLRKLFTSFVLIEICGSANMKSRMFLFDKAGALLEKFALRGFVQKFSGWECEKVLYMPIF